MAAPPIRFAPRDAFFTELKAEVEAHLATGGRDRHATMALHLKTAFLLVGLATVVTTALLMSMSWLTVVPMGVALGLFIGGIGFNIMHDANHGSYSRKPWVNRILGMSLDLLGGSSRLWRVKHNQVHHAWTNIEGVDDDIDVGFLGRMSPEQRWMKAHRFQHLYFWPLYGFLGVKWHWFDDFFQMARGKIGPREIGPLGRGGWALFILGKVVFFTWALVLPIAVMGPALGITFYLIAQITMGVVLAVVFQLAHCVEPAAFHPLSAGPVPVDFARHQLSSTVDFAAGNRLVTWYVGGLNYQAVHHLFPTISHAWYPELSPILARVAEKHGVTYLRIPTLRAAVASHYRFLKRMGARPTPEPATVDGLIAQANPLHP
ncbi:MAG: acyl-CoA desaturase [Myxococcales bacterium]|nr:acyl-CoA desaturase [Myxococcales bacterium]